jgi:putative oxidoreductase
MIDLIRIYLGVALFFKGVYFMGNREALLNMMEGAGGWWFAPAALAHYIVPAHLFGGLMLALGLLTRVAALAQIPVLLGAVFYVHMPRLSGLSHETLGNQNLQLSALVLFLTVLVLLHGAGRFSLDHAIGKHSEHADGLPKPV